jgi:hypothetical protein
MASIRLNKIEAARRQTDAAIRMTFASEDPIAIHTVASAGHRIIRDICEQRGDIESYKRVTDWIVPGRETEFWRYYNATANFLKHADRDAGDVHDLDDEAADFMLILSAKWYRDLGHQPTTEMNAFAMWWTLQNPDLLKPDILAVFDSAGLRPQIETLRRSGHALTRVDWLKGGQMLLESTRRGVGIR